MNGPFYWCYKSKHDMGCTYGHPKKASMKICNKITWRNMNRAERAAWTEESKPTITKRPATRPIERFKICSFKVKPEVIDDDEPSTSDEDVKCYTCNKVYNDTGSSFCSKDCFDRCP